MKKLTLTRSFARQLKRVCLVSAVAIVSFAGQKASAQIVQNGNFEANASSFSGYGLIPGYSAETAGAIPDWIRSSSNSFDGLGGSGTGDTSNSSYSAPPGYNGYSGGGDPSVYYFQQNYQANNTLTQAITLDALTTYTLSFEGAAKVRDGSDVPLPYGDVTVTDDSGTLTDVTVTAATDAGADFSLYSVTFTTGATVTDASINLIESEANPATASGTANQYAADFVEYSNIAITPTGSPTVPEPGTYTLLGVGALGVLLISRRKLKA